MVCMHVQLTAADFPCGRTQTVKQYTSLRIIILNAHTCTHNEVPLTQARCSWNIVGDGKLSSSFSGVNIIHRLKGNWKQPD